MALSRLDSSSDSPKGGNEQGESKVLSSITLVGYRRCREIGCWHKNLGTSTECEKCKKERPLDPDRLKPDENSRVLTDPAEINRANAGPDWVCDACGNNNPFDAECCGGVDEKGSICGINKKDNGVFNHSGRKEWDKVLENSEDVIEQGIKIEQEEAGLLSGGAKTGALFTNVKDKSIEIINTLFSEQHRRKSGLALLGIVFLFTGCPKVIAYFRTHQETGTIDSKERESDIEIEYKRSIHESGRSLPSDAYNETARREIEKYVKVKVGTKMVKVEIEPKKVKSGSHKVEKHIDAVYEEVPTEEPGELVNNGNGTWTRETIKGTKKVLVEPAKTIEVEVDDYEYIPQYDYKPEPIYEDKPVYATKYYYTVDRRETKTHLRAQGINSDPQWPKVNPGHRERLGSKSQSFKICVTTDDNSGCINVSENQYKFYKKGSEIIVDVNGGGTITGISDEKN